MVWLIENHSHMVALLLKFREQCAEQNAFMAISNCLTSYQNERYHIIQ